MEHRTHYWSHVITLLIALSVMLVSLSFSQKKSINKLPVVSEALNSWQQTNGPEGASIHALAYDGQRDYLYMTSNKGTFVRYQYKWYQLETIAGGSLALAPSGDIYVVRRKIGLTYHLTPPSAGSEPSGTLEEINNSQQFFTGKVAVHPSGTVYLLSDQLYQLTGTTWVAIPNSVGGGSLAFVNNNIFIGATNGVFKFDGSTWTQVNSTMPDPNNCNVIAYNPNNSLLYFADTRMRSGIYSYNTITAEILGPITGTENLYFSAITVTSSGDVFAVGPQAIYRNFSEIPETRRVYNQQSPQSLITYGNRIYTVAGSHIMQSAPPYNLWTIPDMNLNQTGLSIIGTSITAMMKNPINNFVFAGTEDGEIFYTSDPDFGWDMIRYSKAIPVERGKITSFAHYYNPQKGYERIFAGREGGGVYYSGGTGWDWGSFNENPLNREVYALTVYPPYEYNTTCADQKQLGKVFAGTEDGLFWSHCIDECDLPDADWGTVVDEDVFQQPIFGLATGPAPSYKLYALTGDNVVRSDDGGDTWTQLIDGLNGPTSIAINSFGHVFVIEGYSVVWRSLDEGNTWTELGIIDDEGNSAGDITSITFNSKGQLFVSDNDNHVFGSNDNGATWHLMITGFNYNYVSVLSRGRDTTLLAGTESFGVWKTADLVANPVGCFDLLSQPGECVAWWSGDNHKLDLSNNEHDLIGAVTFHPSGKFGQAFSFAGFGPFLYISDPSDGDLDFESSNNAFSISAWVNIPSINSSTQTIVSKQEVTGLLEWKGYHFSIINGKLALSLGYGASGVRDYYPNTPIQIPINEWFHVAVTFNGLNPPTFYFGGNAIASMPGSPNAPTDAFSNNAEVYIGYSSISSGSYFNGGIDEVIIYNRVLGTSTEIGSISGNSLGLCKPQSLSARTVNLIQPNVQEITWFIGTTRKIQWQSTCVGKINIEYSVDGGTNWLTIANGVDANDGEYPWTVPTVTTTQALVKISSATQPSTVYDVSDFSFTIRDQWTQIAELNQPTVQWTDASFVTEQVGWIVGTKGNISKTVDGGQTWTTQNQGNSRNFTGISFKNTSLGFATGNNVGTNETFLLKTGTSGDSWLICQNALNPYNMNDVSYSFITKGWWVGKNTTENKGVILDVDFNGNITSTKSFTSPTQFTSIYFIKNTTTGWATGTDGKILKTTDGTNWQELTTNITSTIHDISFVDGQNGWAVGDNGLILSTNDGGMTWTEIMPHPTSQNLYGISMLNKSLGWTVGAGGTVFKYIGPTLAQKAKSRFPSNFSGGWLPYQTEATKDLFTAAFAGGTVGIILGDSGETIGYQPTFEDSFYVSVSTTLNRNWNLVSVPVQVDDYAKTSLFPSALSNAFKFTNEYGYQSSDTLVNQISYWIKDTTENTFNFTGSLVLKDTFELEEGWNMIGSISNPIDVTTITTDPPGILESNFFRYVQGYSVADSIEQGKGYWVKSNRAGRMMLETPENGNSGFAKTVSSSLAQMNRIIVSDNGGNSQTLYLTGLNYLSTEINAELPPLPPSGIFDARFDNNKFIGSFNKTSEKTQRYVIQIQSAEFPIKFDFENVEGITRHITVNGMKLFPGRNIQIMNATNNRIVVEITPEGNIPKAFALYQNYPNPFNPTTTFSFDIPVQSSVSLKVYNLLGQQVAVVTDNDLLNAGLHELHFDATNLASGVYFYRMTALSNEQNFVDVRKMILLK